MEVAEGWAFAAAIMPQLALCSSGGAELVRRNMFLNEQPHVKDGFRLVKATLEAMYPCLGITCHEVGGMLSGGKPIPGMEPCVDPASTYGTAFISQVPIKEAAVDDWSTALVVSVIVARPPAFCLLRRASSSMLQSFNPYPPPY